MSLSPEAARRLLEAVTISAMALLPMASVELPRAAASCVAPAAPTGLKVDGQSISQGSNGSVMQARLSWNPVPGATEYDFRLNVNPTPDKTNPDVVVNDFPATALNVAVEAPIYQTNTVAAWVHAGNNECGYGDPAGMTFTVGRSENTPDPSSPPPSNGTSSNCPPGISGPGC